MKFYFFLASILVLCVAGVGLIAWGYLSSSEPEEVLPVSSVKDGYLACIQAEDAELIGECLSELAHKTYTLYPISEIEAVLDTLTFSQKNRWCHEAMHYYGWRAYHEESGIADAFINSSGLCDSGMYHGVVEEFLRKEGFGGNLEELVRTTCNDSLAGRPDITGGHIGLCHHGLGHGLMYVTSSDLGRSLELCDTLEFDAGGCYSGAFMEFAASKAVGPLANAIDLTDFSYCETLNEKHRPMCYFRQGINNYAAVGGNMIAAVELCTRLPQEHQGGCFIGIGANNPAPNKSHVDSGKECTLALEVSKEAYMGCIEGSVGFVMQLEWGDMQSAMDFCNAADPTYLSECYKYTGKAVKSWLKESETVEGKCSALPGAEAQAQCVMGAREGDQSAQTE